MIPLHVLGSQHGGLDTLLATLVTADAVVTLVQAVAWNLRREPGPPHHDLRGHLRGRRKGGDRAAEPQPGSFRLVAVLVLVLDRN